ncbi:O-succinylbenzoate synthase, partial [Proteus mirabilis]
MRNAKLYSFSLPVDAGVVLRYQRLKTRDGFLVCLEQNGKQGWGEISPLPEFSRETLEQAQEATQSWLTAWCAGENPVHSELPSVAFGISCALAELEDTLPQDANYRAAPLCNGDPDDLILSLNDMEGEKVAKIKVGLYEAVRDGIVVNLLLEAIPDLKLRLDANRSWTPAKAEGFAKYVNPQWR